MLININKMTAWFNTTQVFDEEISVLSSVGGNILLVILG